mgnify:CR=1 FL=1
MSKPFVLQFQQTLARIILIKCIAMIDKSSLYQVGVTYSSNDSDVQFRWLQYDVVNNHWSLVSDWNKSNWTNWYPKNGTYWIYVEARTSDGVVNSMTQGVIVNR